MAKKGGTWNWDNLSQWLTSPKAFAPGTKMTFAGLSNPQDRANVMAFLNTHSDSPQPLPKPPAAAPVAAGKAPGTGPNNGPQKAEKEPVLNTAVAEKIRKTLAAPQRPATPSSPTRSFGPRALLPRRLRMLGIEALDEVPCFLRVLAQWMR